MSTKLLFAVLLAVGCAGSQRITQDDLTFERECNGDKRQAWGGLCDRHASEMAAKRAALAVVDADAKRERDCYVLLEDPASTPETRGECRQYLAGLAEKRADARAAQQAGASISAGVLAGGKK